MSRLKTAFLFLIPACAAIGGPYDGEAGSPGSLAIPADSPAILGWASGVASLIRGPADISNTAFGFASFGEPALALGPATSDPLHVVSLGDGGSITLTFGMPIANGVGPDFAVFENSFNDAFLELAFVEVSSDGLNFIRFPSVSLTPTDVQIGTFGTVDPTDIHNLAGKHAGGYGTPFDLADLVGLNPDLDLMAITHVRLVDVIGSVNPTLASTDSGGRLINDPWPTPFATGGFDLDAVAVLNTVPEPSTAALALGCFALLGAMHARRRGQNR